MPLGAAASDAIIIITSLRAISYFLQHNETGEIRSCTFLFQSPWSAQLSSSQTPRAFNENCGRPNFLCCPWFARPQIIRWGATQKDQCGIFIVSLHHFSVHVNFSILCFLWTFCQNWIYSIIPFSFAAKNIYIKSEIARYLLTSWPAKSESASSLTCVWFFVIPWTVAH